MNVNESQHGQSAVPVKEVLHPNLRSPSSYPRHPWLDVLGAVLVVGFFAGGAWSSYWANQRNDQYQLLGLGECVYQGERLYVDCWENKPPGLAWINALGLLTTAGRPLGAWALPALAGILSVAILWIAVSKLLGPTPGRRTAVFAAALFSTRAYDAASINPDFYAGIIELSAVGCWLSAIAGEARWRTLGLAAVAGLIWSAATSVKQTGCAGLLAVSVVSAALIPLRSSEARRWAAITFVSWLGFALGCGAVIFILSKQGVLNEARAAVVDFNRTLLDPKALWDALLALPQREPYFVPLYLPLCLSVFGVVTTILVGRAGVVSKPVIYAGAVWVILAAWTALAGPSGAMRYWQALFPPLLLLSAVALFHLGEMFRRLERSYQIAYVVLCIAAMFPLARPLFRTYRLGLAESYLAYGDEQNDRKRLEAQGAQIRDVVPEVERIYVWNYDAGVYSNAHRRPSSRYTYPRTPEQMTEILTNLKERKPYAILIPATEGGAFAPFCKEDCLSERDAILKAYNKARTVGAYDVWVRATVEEKR